MKLITEVRSSGIHIRFFPLHRKFIGFSFDDIENFEPIIYKPVKKYGGWGIHYSVKGKA